MPRLDGASAWRSTSSALLVRGVPVYVRHDLPPVEAIGILDGRVTAVGTADQVRAALPPGTPERQLARGAVLPAFIDPHQHAYLVAADPGVDALYRRATNVAGLIDEIARRIADEDGVPRPRRVVASSWL